MLPALPALAAVPPPPELPPPLPPPPPPPPPGWFVGVCVLANRPLRVCPSALTPETVTSPVVATTIEPPLPPAEVLASIRPPLFTARLPPLTVMFPALPLPVVPAVMLANCSTVVC